MGAEEERHPNGQHQKQADQSFIDHPVQFQGRQRDPSLGTQGDNPCHVSLSDKGFLAVSNHGGGSVAIFKLNGDGLFEEGEPQIIDHKVLDTVKRAHAHMAKFIGDELFVADFGLLKENDFS